MTNVSDITIYIISKLRTGNPVGQYGYEAWLPYIMNDYLEETKGARQLGYHDSKEMKDISPFFYASAWELCRRGIIRPGIEMLNKQATADGSSGNGYSITPFGQKWLDEEGHDDFVPTEPERFGEMIARFQARFGPGFNQRAQEAIRCYGAHADLACCVMCGAAAESILLAVACTIQQEKEVLQDYRRANGRQKITNLIIGQKSKQIKSSFLGFMELMNYWRDDAAHGMVSRISNNESFTSLASLLRFSTFVDDNWSELSKIESR